MPKLLSSFQTPVLLARKARPHMQPKNPRFLRKACSFPKASLRNLLLQVLPWKKIENSNSLFWDLDGPICANRFTDSRESPDSRKSLRLTKVNPSFFCECHFGALTFSKVQVWGGSHKSLEHYANSVFLQIESSGSIRAPIRVANRRAI